MRNRVVAGLVASLLVLVVWFAQKQADSQLEQIERGEQVTYIP